MLIQDNLFDSFFNQIIIQDLNQCSWKMASCPTPDGKCDSGIIYESWHVDWGQEAYSTNKMNCYAEIILKKFLKDAGDLGPIGIHRYWWNYFNRANAGSFHKDINENSTDCLRNGQSKVEDFYSIVYSLNTCDGGTMIEDQFVKSEEGRAVMFPSNLEHRGIGPTVDAQRYNLNIIIQRLP